MSQLRVRNWDRFQHYKSKNAPPPWIKLYTDTLTNYDFLKLGDADRYKLIGVWMLAAKTNNIIPNDPVFVARCIGVKRVDLALFVTSGFLEVVYDESRPALEPVYEHQSREEDLKINAEKNPAIEDFNLERLLLVLTDRDAQTAVTIRRMIASRGLTPGDLEAAREAALGNGVESRTRVAVAELKKRKPLPSEEAA